MDQRGLLIIYTSITSIEEINEVLSSHHHRELLAALFQPQLDKVWSEKWVAPRATSPNSANGTRRQLWFGSNVSTQNNPAAIDPIARIALPETTSNAYNNMLLHLLHCDLNTFLDPIVSLCVAHFQPVITDMALVTNHDKMEEEWHRQTVKYEHVHEILRAVVRLVPMYREILLDKLQIKNPSIQQPKLLHQHYLENLLVLSKYAVDLRKDITTMVVDKIMELDAQVKIEGDDDDDDDDDDQLNVMFSSLQPADISSRYYNRIMADKLDSVILLFFRHIESINKDATCENFDSNNIANNASHLESIFRSMLSMFEEKIIRSSKLHSTQFLMFYICSVSSSFSKSFIEYLMTIVMDTHRHTITRVMGIMYIASFLSRANYLTEDMVVLTLGHLTQYIRHYIKTFERTVTTIDVKSHQIFYSMSQCVFYVLCYKIDQVMNAGSQSKSGGGGGKEYLTRLLLPDLIALVNSRFNPFKVLPTDVVEEVTRTFKKYELHDFTETVDRNRDIVLSEGQMLFAQENHIGASQTGLSTEDIFPFDPFLLAQSKDYIEPIYQHWHYGRTYGSSNDYYGSGSFSSSAGKSSAGGINIYARRNHYMDDMDESSLSMGSTPGSYLRTGSLSIQASSNRRQIGHLLNADMAMRTPSLSDDEDRRGNGQRRRQRRESKASVRYLSVNDLSKNHGHKWSDMDEDMDSADDDDSDDSDIAADDSSEEYGEEDEDENSLHMHNVRRERRHSDARSGFISILDQRSFSRKQGFSQSLANGWAEYLESDDDEAM